ncbi:hypothetical protein EMIHUDRAFT_454691 [Emiliania huxleyi CCMP1516]|uniref:ABC transmembrane type-1 domain-containing protein n=3 Tax=Emiliania huxleyi TaxID=2903 RepID=A0A0D3KRB6_EMIH1|nr:hypothetical protein EMIHUDRAFT_454691 [Emiliania huxleyi CCMP1516]EOD38301.1 hypothetical protein EMIHUDRAFT_454691 [Emiliania huxleyi CCMP1516]|eukprot:XP_005790730.1 hypothetical protein EMIHUDRAFT_454691 [Emiliania huxleyi CCMP1516]
MERVTAAEQVPRVGDTVRLRPTSRPPALAWPSVAGPAAEAAGGAEAGLAEAEASRGGREGVRLAVVVDLLLDDEEREVCQLRAAAGNRTAAPERPAEAEGGGSRLAGSWLALVDEVEVVDAASGVPVEPTRRGSDGAAGSHAQGPEAAAAAALSSLAASGALEAALGERSARADVRSPGALATRLGWALGASAARAVASGSLGPRGQPNKPKGGAAGTKADSPDKAAEAAAAAAAVGGARVGGFAASLALHLARGLSPFLWFLWTLGAYLSLLAVLADTSLSRLVATAAATLPALLGAPAAARGLAPPPPASSSVPPALFALMRLPSMVASGALLHALCLKPVLPRCLRSLACGFEEGFRAATRGGWRNGANAAARAALEREEALLRSVSGSLRRAAAVVQAARASSISIAVLVAVEWLSRQLPLPPQPLSDASTIN